jgi:hypothetical protein
MERIAHRANGLLLSPARILQCPLYPLGGAFLYFAGICDVYSIIPRRRERGSRWRIKDGEIGPILPILLSLFSATSSMLDVHHTSW